MKTTYKYKITVVEEKGREFAIVEFQGEKDFRGGDKYYQVYNWRGLSEIPEYWIGDVYDTMAEAKEYIKGLG